MATTSFKFISDAAGGDQFTVVSFTGHESISTLYRYEIELKALLTAEIDLDDVLDSPARFITEHEGAKYPVHGVLSSFEELRTVQNYSYFKAVLVPKIWKLSNYRTNEIFYQGGAEGDPNPGQGIDAIISQVFEKAGLNGSEFDIAGLSGSLLNREYRCQYNESDFDFISRLLENEGVFYYFEQGEFEEKIIFINDQNYLSIPRAKLLFDVAAQARDQHNCIHALSCRKQRLPEQVIVRDYNPDEPSLDVSDITPIDSMGQGIEYIYGKNVKSDTEATYLSQIRAEEFICRKTQFFGESSVTRLQAGYVFSLDGHPNDKYNGVEYLAIEVSHEGQHLDMDLSGPGQQDSKPQYQNSFIAIPGEVQYRPPRKTPKPKITGTLHAVIDGELDSEYAQLDSEGRYKVSLPFDFHNEEHPQGLASARVRMMQPYAGKNRGMQFPMAKGTEVLLSFIDGDPDRPIIAGAINSAAAPGPVNADNQSESVIQTGSNNKIRMEDNLGSERIMLESPASNSWIRVGSKNDPIILNGHSPVYIINDGVKYTDPGAYAHSQDDETVISVGLITGSVTNSSGDSILEVDTNTTGQYFLTYEDDTDGTGMDTAVRQVFVYDPAQVDDLEIPEGTFSDGIRIRSAGNLWLEAQSRYGQYHTGRPLIGPTNGGTGPSEIGDLIAKFGHGYNPTNLKNHSSPSTIETVAQAIASAHVHVSSLDTFTTQEGNIYDFGGYWEYNMGNSYTENFMDQDSSVTLNDVHDKDLAAKGGPEPGSIPTNSPDQDTSVNNTAGPLNNNTWIEKTIGGAAYEYTRDKKSLEVSVGCTSVAHTYGQTSYEYGYTGQANKTSYSKSGSGRSESKSWHRDSGNRISHSKSDASAGTTEEWKYDSANNALYSYSTSHVTGMRNASFEFDFSAHAHAAFKFGAVASTETYGGAKLSNSNYIGPKIDISGFLGGKIDIQLSAAGILETKNAEWETTFPGFEAEGNTNKIDTKAVDIKSHGSQIGTCATGIQSIMSALSANGITIMS